MILEWRVRETRGRSIEAREWVEFEQLLAPDVHWTTAVEEHLHGRQAVVERLSHDFFKDGSLAVTVLGNVNGLHVSREDLALG